MNLITILTPTYNRKNKLQELYQSLCCQNNFNFKWLIVDDGSNDSTAEYINNIKNNGNFEVDYIRKENGGKHTALNTGIKVIETDLTLIVDSDDRLVSNAIEEIEQIHNKYKENKKIGCYTFLRANADGVPIVPLERDEFVENYIDYRIRGNRPGDMAEVFKTNILKDNPFPEFKNEKFLSEDVCWIEIGKKYDSVYVNKAIYECEYLKGGLTDNDKPLKFASPNGSMMRGIQLMSKRCGLVANIKGAIIYNAYKCQKHEVEPNSIYEKALIAITKPLGMYYKHKWKKSFTNSRI